jgi:hypothetical protein
MTPGPAAATAVDASRAFPGPAAAAPSLADDLRCGHGAPPCLAYLLVGARGDGARLLRLLLAVYHPRNRYVLHLSADASDSERRDLAAWVAAATPAVGAFRNVAVVGAPTAGTPVGSSGLAGTLRAAAVLLRLHPDWDWFITLNAADYPVVTQDGMVIQKYLQFFFLSQNFSSLFIWIICIQVSFLSSINSPNAAFDLHCLVSF